MKRLPRVCIIGAGSSGIAAAKAMYDRGIPFDCYEKSDRVGGLWVLGNKNGMSAAYRSLHINTSRDRMEYADYAMPSDYPDFPHHTLIARYFEAYVDHFGFRHKITFETSVETAVRRADGVWEVAVDSGETFEYDALLVANGHHWDARWPEPAFPGSFDGLQTHSHDYIDPCEPHDLVGKRVVVVGMGNSAMDIACELSTAGVADKVFLSGRRGAHIIPHYLFGKPLDQLLPLPPWIPWSARRGIGSFFYRLAVGDVTDYGLPKPDHELGQAHPTISSDLLPKLGRGDITPVRNIDTLMGDSIRFVDGRVEKVDAIIYCTGYNVTFPFFDDSFISAPGNDLPLFFRMAKPGLDDVFFIGLLQPLGAIMPISEAQSKWIASYLCGDYSFPNQGEMTAAMDKKRAAMLRRYIASPRHTMQVDFDDYLHELQREVAAGRRRARTRGNPLPVPALARRPGATRSAKQSTGS